MAGPKWVKTCNFLYEWDSIGEMQDAYVKKMGNLIGTWSKNKAS